MSFKCPDCGATLKDESRFCNYCGAKIDDGVKRMEIKIDKRIEDVAEVKRAGYEEKESNARVRKMEREHRAGKAKRIAMISLVIFGVLFFAIGLIFNIENVAVSFLSAFLLITSIIVFCGIIYQLITGKW